MVLEFEIWRLKAITELISWILVLHLKKMLKPKFCITIKDTSYTTTEVTLVPSNLYENFNDYYFFFVCIFQESVQVLPIKKWTQRLNSYCDSMFWRWNIAGNFTYHLITRGNQWVSVAVLRQGQAKDMDWTIHTNLWKSETSRDIKKSF